MKKRVITILCVLFWLTVWQLGAMALDQKILLVTPVAVVGRLAELVPKPDFWASVAGTAGKILLGFALGLAAGTGLALLSGRASVIRRLLAPLISVLKSVPVASFTILALIWVSSEDLSVLVSFLICVPIVYTNMLEGLDNLDPKLKTMAELFHIPPWRRFVGVYLSQLLPYFRSASGLAIGLCWKSGVAAEVIGIPDGSIGERLYMSKIYLETADLFAWTLVVILASRLCEGIFTALVRLAVKRVENM